MMASSSSQGAAMSFGIRAGLASSSATASLLAHETSIGKFSGVLDLLDSHHALLLEVQQLCYGLTLHDVEFRVNMLLRALRFVVEQVWPEYQNWKYVRIRQQIEIGQRCVQIFERILIDQTLIHASPATARLRGFIESALVVNTASPLMIAPLLHVIVTRQNFVGGLQKAKRFDEVELAREHIESSMRLARIIVECRIRRNRDVQSGSSQAMPRALGHIEHAFVEDLPWIQSSHGTARRKAGSLERSMNLASAAVHSIFASEDYGIACEAAKLVTTVCSALAEFTSTPAPALISRLGSPSDVEATLTSLLDLIENADEYAELRALTLNMLAALVAGQPVFATLLLTGKHVAANVEEHDGARTSSQSSEKVLRRTALEIAVKISQDCDIIKVFSDIGELQCLDAALKFLGVAWQHALEHGTEFKSWRQSKHFWKTLLDMACRDTGAFSTNAEEIAIVSDQCVTERDDEVRRAVLGKACSARALHLIATDISLAPLLSNRSYRGPGQSSIRAPARLQSEWPSLDCIINLLKDQTGLRIALESALLIQCDPLRHTDVLMRMEQAFPELPLDQLRLPARLNDFDYEKQYGNAYVYSVGTLRDKLNGLLRGTSTTEAVEIGSDTDAVLQAMLLVAGINLDWSAIDGQTIYLRAWSALLSTVIGPLFDRMEEDKVLAHDIQRNVTDVWVGCARIVADEQLATTVTQDIHTLRISLLAVLLDTAWEQNRLPNDNRQLQNDFGDQDLQRTLDVMDQTARIITHPVLSVEDAMRRAPLDPTSSFHRDASRIVLVCTRHYRAVRRHLQSGGNDLLRQSISAGGSRNGDAERLRDMQRFAETFASHTIPTMRIALDRCLASLSSPTTTAEAVLTALDLDLKLLAASLALLLHHDSGISVQVWLPKLHTCSLLQVACDLFGRAPILQGDKSGAANAGRSDSADSLVKGVVPCYWQTLLDFFLDLACQPNTAEAVILAGVMNALSVNAFSSALENASSPSSESPLTYSMQTAAQLTAAGTKENALHGSWIKILRIVTMLMGALDTPHRQAFVQQEVSSFFRIFHPLLDACLARPLFDISALASRLLYGENGSGSGQPARSRRATKNAAQLVPDKARMNELAEITLVLALYSEVLRVYTHQINELDSSESSTPQPLLTSGSHNEHSRRHTKAVRQHVDRLVSSYIARTTLRLQEAVHLLQHPHELAALLGLDTLIGSDGVTSPIGHKKVRTAVNASLAVRHLVQACNSIIESFWMLSRGFETLCSSDAGEWDLDGVLVIPTIGTSPSRPSSIGTLLDFASYLTDSIQSLNALPKSAMEPDELVPLIAALEQTLSLSTIQLARAMYGHASPSQQAFNSMEPSSLTRSAGIQSIEVEAGLGRDVSHSTDAAASAIAAVGEKIEASKGSLRAYIDVVAAFQRRWLVPSSE